MPQNEQKKGGRKYEEDYLLIDNDSINSVKEEIEDIIETYIRDELRYFQKMLNTWMDK